ncbi:MAG: hypothetical protein IKZ34_04155 [Alphaproteobacteria bacterium]|nr:hypothetical protein [Alphaproteobacteria bacterium]
MKFYKALLTLSGAGMISSCVPLSQITHPAQGRVIEKREYGVCLDSDNDGLADACMDIIGTTARNNQCYFYDYIELGDTLKYRTTNDEPVLLSADLYRNVVLDSVNSRSVKDLKRIYEINVIRNALEQEKAR